MFDLNLILNDTWSVLTNKPRSIAGHNNQMYVGKTSANSAILVAANKIIIRTTSAACTTSAVISIWFDYCGFMSISCESNKLIKLFSNE